jgi:hypothetical protein
MVSIARKLRKKNNAKDKFVHFGENITGAEVTNPKNVLGSITDEDGYNSLESKHHKSGSKNKIVCFGQGIKGTKITNPKTELGSSLGEDF